MKNKYRVRYWMRVLKESIVEADSPEDAFERAAEGDTIFLEKTIEETYESDANWEEVKK